jgi:dihydroorotase
MLEKKNGAAIYLVDNSAMPQTLLIKNGRVIDPANSIDEKLCIGVENGRIAWLSKDVPAGFTAQKEIDAEGMWVTPGLADMHVHLREPGREDKETIETGTQAACAGGFTAVACMPNTNPALDEESKIRYVVQRAQDCTCRVFPIGSITKGLAGEELSPFGEMVRAGARAVSDDGKSVRKASIMKNALNYSKSFGIPVICHCEDSDLSHGGHMNEGAMSSLLGVWGQPSIAEEIIVSRDILLASYTGARIHIAHVSTEGSVRIVREAKSQGIAVTCETCPHYIALTDEDLSSYNTNMKMNPPLRTRQDRDALVRGLADGTIDVIASDHAPHVSEEKDVEFDAAAFGVIGLETSLPVVLTDLLDKGILSPSEIVRKMSVNPNRILGLGGGTLSSGVNADITITDPRVLWTVDSKYFFSKGRNTPFEGLKVKGCARYTILGGAVVFERKVMQ